MFFQPTFTNQTYSVPFYGSYPFVAGLELTITGNTTFTLTPGSARAFNANDVIVFNPFLTPGLGPTLNVDISTTGLLGCYPLPINSLNLADRTNFSVYLLGDTGGIAPTTAIVATGNNFLPVGYNVWRRIGSIYVDQNTFYMYPFAQSGIGNDRTYLLKDIIPGANFGPTVNIPYYLSFPNSTKSPCNPNFVSDAIIYNQLTPATYTDYGSITSTNQTLVNTPAPITIKAEVPYVPMRPGVSTLPVSLDANGNAVVYITVVGTGAIFFAGIAGWKESMGLQAI